MQFLLHTMLVFFIRLRRECLNQNTFSAYPRSAKEVFLMLHISGLSDLVTFWLLIAFTHSLLN